MNATVILERVVGLPPKKPAGDLLSIQAVRAIAATRIVLFHILFIYVVAFCVDIFLL
jgi:peptidoglycan/LPS O-acetylase OafA/YrhL